MKTKFTFAIVAAAALVVSVPLSNGSVLIALLRRNPPQPA